QIIFTLDTNYTMQDTLNFCGNISATNSIVETNYLNNSQCIFLNVVASYDPNDKTVTTHDGHSSYLDENDSLLYYTIRFQNTGCAPAYNIKILDTLNSYLDFSSFKVLSASHAYSYRLYDQSGIVAFYFNEIMLPDSGANYEESNGYILYSVKINNQFTDGDSITNAASIYFDYNPFVQTNTVVSKFMQPPVIGIKKFPSNKYLVYPNPTTGKITIDLEKNYKEIDITVRNLLGQTILNKTDKTTNQLSFEIIGKVGVYFVEIRTEEGESAVVKVVKE
ncbi:MAG: T9SS type A sorting domain-containing protein, partial [Saprospiraceae bacterium]|nr:T9SS type A sorting domain-containing protein [Saprospiraceae bacterium]